MQWTHKMPPPPSPQNVTLARFGLWELLHWLDIPEKVSLRDCGLTEVAEDAPVNEKRNIRESKTLFQQLLEVKCNNLHWQWMLSNDWWNPCRKNNIKKADASTWSKDFKTMPSFHFFLSFCWLFTRDFQRNSLNSQENVSLLNK